jgi:glycosyltransferase involved in cell wall biosynthesis
MEENNNKLSLIIPAYQEGEGIDSVLKEVVELKNKNHFIDQIIIVDDGSRDNTSQIAESYSEITLIKHSKNRGYGAALKTGILNAKNEIISITDADGTYPNNNIPFLFNELINNDLDMIVGARTGEKVKIPLVRKPAKWAIGKLANWVTGTSIPDINSGLRIFKKSSFLPFQNIVPDGFSFTTTITLGMISGKYKVKFTPINYFKRSGKSKIRPIADTLNFIKLILRIGLYFAPYKIFMPISFSFFLLSIIWGLFSKYYIGELADVSSLIIAMTGFQIAILAFIAELINHRVPNKYMA